MLAAHGTSNARDVTILLHRDTKVKIISTTRDNNGIYLNFKVKHNNIKYSLINSYAPTTNRPKKQIALLDELEEQLHNLDPINVILEGDLNFYLNPSMDKFTRKNSKILQGHQHNRVVGKRLESFMEEFHLYDAWRHLNPITRQYTFRRKAYASRLNYWLIFNHLTEYLYASNIAPVALSDHAIDSMPLQSIREQREPSCWRFDCNLLNSELFVIGMIDFFSKDTSIHEFSSPQSHWDYLKYEIIKFTISFN